MRGNKAVLRGGRAGWCCRSCSGCCCSAAVVLSDDAGVDELVDVDELDAGVVLLEVDLLSVL